MLTIKYDWLIKIEIFVAIFTWGMFEAQLRVEQLEIIRRHKDMERMSVYTLNCHMYAIYLLWNYTDMFVQNKQ